jgi:phage FluMu protein Com
MKTKEEIEQLADKAINKEGYTTDDFIIGFEQGYTQCQEDMANEIAARKIYATYDIKLKQEVDVVCPKCKGVNEYLISDKGDYKCAYTDCQHKF